MKMATSSDSVQSPLGITQLTTLDHVVISQEDTSGRNNKYSVLSSDGSLLLYAREEKGKYSDSSSGSRPFNITICDTQDSEVIQLRRPWTWGADKMEVSVCGRVASVVRQKLTFVQPVLFVNDADDQPLLKIKGDKGFVGLERDFEVFSGKERIGVIKKVWKGARHELSSRADDFDVRFPGDLDVRYKCALIGAALLLDYIYYEK